VLRASALASTGIDPSDSFSATTVKFGSLQCVDLYRPKLLIDLAQRLRLSANSSASSHPDRPREFARTN
jgi:hypothetical protein